MNDLKHPVADTFRPFDSGVNQQRTDFVTALLHLHNQVYNVELRIRGFTRKLTIPHLSTFSMKRAVNEIRKVLPIDLNRSEAAQLAVAHAATADALLKKWQEITEEQALKHFGRPWQFGDYKVSGIASDEFDEEAKSQLRRASTGQTAHKHLALLWAEYARGAK